MNLTVTMRVLDQLSLKVKYLRDGARNGLKFGLSEGAALIAEEAKIQVPVDTGNLRDRIHVEQGKGTAEKQTALVTPVNEAANEYGFDPAYARRIEFGFVGQDKLGRVYNQGAQPYMRPAFEMRKGDAREAIRESVYAALDDAANRVAMKRH